MDEVAPDSVALYQLQLEADGSLHYYFRPGMNNIQAAAVAEALRLSITIIEEELIATMEERSGGHDAKRD